MIDAERFAADLYASMKMLIDRRECELLKRIEVLEARQTDIDPDAIVERLRKAIPAGKDGRDGVDGAPGRDGADGANGVDGKNGVDGAPGKDGRDGIDGKNGTDGMNGKDGADGIHGKDGANGIDGKDGRDGLNGKDGRDGLNGKDGAPGERGEKGLDGIDGKSGAAGRDGREGKDGIDGINGENGRDASAIDYVEFDSAKSYPRGTHALCRGGIMYAERTTDRVIDGDYKAAGWRSLVAGLADVKAALLSDGRTFELAFEYSDGRVEKQQAKAAIPAHRGVWRDAITYEKGDVVQWSGNGWIAREVTTDKPGDSKAWDLLARRGRDGKDSA
jgi:hypothetical protein